MILLAIQKRAFVFPFKVVPISQLHHDSAFQILKNICFTQNAARYAPVTIHLPWQHNRMRNDGFPKLFIGHGFKPIFNFVQAVKSLQAVSLSNSAPLTQILRKPYPLNLHEGNSYGK